MGGSLRPVLVMAECEKVIVNQFIEDQIAKFYIRMRMFHLPSKKDIDPVFNKVNSFRKNLKFTIDTFEKLCVLFSSY